MGKILPPHLLRWCTKYHWTNLANILISHNHLPREQMISSISVDKDDLSLVLNIVHSIVLCSLSYLRCDERC